MCIFSILNWFYPYKNWGISVDKAISFDLIYKGSKLLIEEFPSSEDLLIQKKKLKKSKLDKLRGMWYFWNFKSQRCVRISCIGSACAYSIEDKKDVVLYLLMEKFSFRKKTGVSWRSFY